jgi:hypothetical protein
LFVVALCLRTSLFLEVELNFYFLLFVLFSTVLTYNFQRLVRLFSGNYKNVLSRHLDNKRASIYIILFLLPIVILLCFRLSQKTLLTLGPLFLISFLYPINIFRKSNFYYSLRELPFVKIFLISGVWTITSTFLVAFEHGVVLDSNFLFLVIERFLFVFAITIPFDIRDLKFDNKKMKTLPVYFGVSSSKLIAYFCLIVCVIINWFYSNQNNQLFYSNFLTCFVAVIFIKNSFSHNKDFYFSFCVESLSVLLYVSYFVIP